MKDFLKFTLATVTGIILSSIVLFIISMVTLFDIGSDFKNGRYWSERVVQTEGATAPQLIYTDNGTSLSIQLEGGNKCQVVSDYDYFPFAYEGGCFHLIDDVF